MSLTSQDSCPWLTRKWNILSTSRQRGRAERPSSSRPWRGPRRSAEWPRRGAGPRPGAASRAAPGRAVSLCRCLPALSSPNRHRLHEPLRSALRRPSVRRSAGPRRTAWRARAAAIPGARGGDHAGPSRRLRRAGGRARRIARLHCTPLQRQQELCCARRADQMAAEPHEDALHQEAAPVLEPQPVLELERAPELEPN